MRCGSVDVSYVSQNVTQRKSFKGIPERIGYMNVKNCDDALKYWDLLKQAKFLDVHSDAGTYKYRQIREENYSFLEQLYTYADKSEFIEKFCRFTRFPDLTAVSKKIKTTFNDCLKYVSKFLNPCYYSTSNPYGLVDSGYDPTCSVALKKALPGSDLDKGYIILNGDHQYKSDEEVVNEFKGALWENLDQRIVSLNHPETFPEVFTKKQVQSELDYFNPVAAKILDKEEKVKIGKGTSMGALLAGAVLGTLAIPAGLLIGGELGADDSKFFDIKHSKEIDPFKAGKFNRKVAELLPNCDRERAKKFAFFAETVEANIVNKNTDALDDILMKIKDSVFVKNSNVTQIGAWLQRINDGYLKTKLRNREKLSDDFYSMSTDQKYELIKDVIKYSSNDQSSKFQKYFKNDDDIKNRYERLLSALK